MAYPGAKAGQYQALNQPNPSYGANAPPPPPPAGGPPVAVVVGYPQQQLQQQQQQQPYGAPPGRTANVQVPYGVAPGMMFATTMPDGYQVTAQCPQHSGAWRTNESIIFLLEPKN